MLKVFIGYDPREAIAYHVCVNSIIRKSSVPLSVTPLALNNLAGYSEKHADGSNQFIYSRFLVPHLTGFSGWAIFMDGDMLLREDIQRLSHEAQGEIPWREERGLPAQKLVKRHPVELWTPGEPDADARIRGKGDGRAVASLHLAR
jgi:hypothetical protein